MYRVIGCLTQKHDLLLLLVAATVCIIGCCLTSLMARRMIFASNRRKPLQVGMTGLMAATTVWSTHFVAMLAYDPGVEHGYEPVLTGLSLVVAASGMAASFTLLAYGQSKSRELIAGAAFGLTVSTMHFIGMNAFQIPGDITWIGQLVSASIFFGVALGAFSFHRIARPVTRLCWLGGAILMMCAIIGMHFTAMGAVEIHLSPEVAVPKQFISDVALGILVLLVMSLILLVGFAMIGIEQSLESEAEDQLVYASHHDSLTSLPNRVGLSHHLMDVAEILARDETANVAILTIDLNLFKEINDLYGHKAGDIALQTVAARLIEVMTEQEFISRTGGDEFVAVRTGYKSEKQVIAFAKRIEAAISEPIDIREAAVLIGGAIGIASSLDGSREIDDLQQRSLLAMNRAKAEREVNICNYNAVLDRPSHERLQLAQDLRQAVANGELELVYQLQNDLMSLEPMGFEALLRWNHPTKGSISPGVFIPIAEETGLIRSIGIWVLRTACAEAASWSQPFSIAVNVAPLQLVQASFVEQVSEILRETGLSPERLELEVTEASIIHDQANTLRVMLGLKGMGIRIAMDDFGTGYSSLATLQAFPFDKIKIDRSFVRDLHKNQQRAAIVRSTLLLGDALNIPVLAEGVETAEELQFLREERCNSVQGFYFGKPMSRTDLHRIIAGHIALRA